MQTYTLYPNTKIYILNKEIIQEINENNKELVKFHYIMNIVILLILLWLLANT